MNNIQLIDSIKADKLGAKDKTLDLQNMSQNGSMDDNLEVVEAKDDLLTEDGDMMGPPDE